MDWTQLRGMLHHWGFWALYLDSVRKSAMTYYQSLSPISMEGTAEAHVAGIYHPWHYKMKIRARECDQGPGEGRSQQWIPGPHSILCAPKPQALSTQKFQKVKDLAGPLLGCLSFHPHPGPLQIPAQVLPFGKSLRGSQERQRQVLVSSSPSWNPSLVDLVPVPGSLTTFRLPRPGWHSNPEPAPSGTPKVLSEQLGVGMEQRPRVTSAPESRRERAEGRAAVGILFPSYLLISADQGPSQPLSFPQRLQTLEAKGLTTNQVTALSAFCCGYRNNSVGGKSRCSWQGIAWTSL